jgi:hypothetical protein
VDEKAQIQALNRTQRLLPMWPGLPARRTHDYTRHGTTSLFAALEVARGNATRGFIAFLNSLARRYPRREIHLICDNYGTRKASGRGALAGGPSAHSPSLHPDQSFVDQLGRALVRTDYGASDPTRQL